MRDLTLASALEIVLMFALGGIFGLIVFHISGLEIKWFAYFLAAVVFCVAQFLAPRQDWFLWTALVLSFQADVSFRILYGYAGSDGFVFPLTLVLGVYFFLWNIFSGDTRVIHSTSFGRPMAVPIVLLFITSIISLVNSSEQFVGATEFLRLCSYYFLFWLALNWVRSEKQLQYTVTLLLVNLAFQSLVYYVQSALGITFTLVGKTIVEQGVIRPGGTVATNGAGFASFVLPLMTLAMAYFLALTQWNARRVFLGVLIGLSIGALFLTYTRAAWGSFVIGTAWLMILGYRRRFLSMKILIISAILMFFLVMIAMQIIVSTRANTNLNSAYQERFDLMRMAGHVIAAHPLTGVGIGAYEHTFKNYIPPHLQGAWKYTVHNYYLLHTAEKGLVGGLAFIALLLTGLKTAARLTRSRLENVRLIAWGISAGIVALAFEMYWDTWTGFTYNALLWFLLGLLGAAQRIDKESGKGI